jgi:mannosyltransferase
MKKGVGRVTKPAVAPRLPRSVSVAIPAVLAATATFILTMQELGKPSPWRDEAVTLGVSTRSFSQILHLFIHIDGVLVPYYLAMHVVLGTHPDIFLARLPSVVASTLTAALLAVLGARLFGLRAAYLAGALYIVVPMTSRYAQEARPYAITGLIAVGATFLLVHALETGNTRWFAGYTAAMVLLAYANLLALLLLAAHAVTVCTFRRVDRLQRWLISAVITMIAAGPLIWAGAHETVALQGLTRPDLRKLATIISGMSGTWTAFWWLLGATVIGVVVIAAAHPRRSRHIASTTSAAGLLAWSAVLPWLLLPPVLLFAVSQVKPLYSDRYLVFCLPAFALVIAGAVSRLPLAIPVALVVVVVGLTSTVQHNIRSEAGHTEDLHNLAKQVIGQSHPNDGVLFLPARLRVIDGAYPAMTHQVDDIALAKSGAASDTLYGTEIAPSAVNAAVAPHRRVWLVTSVRTTFTTPTDAAKLPALAKNYHLVWKHVYTGKFVLELYSHN